MTPSLTSVGRKSYFRNVISVKRPVMFQLKIGHSRLRRISHTRVDPNAPKSSFWTFYDNGTDSLSMFVALNTTY